MAGASVNKVIIVGNLGRDPEVRYTGSGKAVATFTVATNERRGGEDHVEWHKIVVWDRAAENCGRYLSKGAPVYIEGRLHTRKWQDRDGRDQYTTEIVAYQVQFLGAPRDGQARRDGPPPPDDHGRGQRNEAPHGGHQDDDEDVPF